MHVIHSDTIASALHTLSLESGYDAEFGNVENWNGWNARFDLARPEWFPVDPDDTDDNSTPVPCVQLSAGTYVLTITTQGLKHVTYYHDWERETADREWTAAEHSADIVR